MTTITIIVASCGALNISSHIISSLPTHERFNPDHIVLSDVHQAATQRVLHESGSNLLSSCHLYIWRHQHHLLYTTLENIIHNLMLCSTLDNISASFSCSGASLNTSTPHIHRVASTPDHRYHRQLGALDVPDHIVPSHVRQASAPFVDLS